VDLADKELRSVTWVYDPTTDTVVWSDSLEEFFGFENGTLGFSVSGPTSDGSDDRTGIASRRPSAPTSATRA